MYLQLEEKNSASQIFVVPNTTQSIFFEEPTLHDPHLSPNGSKGGNGVRVIRFSTYMDKLPLMGLIDSGSSNNLLHPRIAKFQKHLIEPAHLFKVMVGNDNYMTTEGLVQSWLFKLKCTYFSYLCIFFQFSELILL